MPFLLTFFSLFLFQSKAAAVRPAYPVPTCIYKLAIATSDSEDFDYQENKLNLIGPSEISRHNTYYYSSGFIGDTLIHVETFRSGKLKAIYLFSETGNSSTNSPDLKGSERLSLWMSLPSAGKTVDKTIDCYSQSFMNRHHSEEE